MLHTNNSNATQSQVTNFNFINIPTQAQSTGKVHRIENFNWQQAHLFGESFNIQGGILTLTQSIDDGALVMDVNNNNYADNEYYIRSTMKLGDAGSFTFAGLLAHADTGGTAHPETEGVALGIMKISGQYYFRFKQWTDGDIFGYAQGTPVLNSFDPDKWYTLELHVKPRGVNDTQFDGAIYLTNNQVNPTVADIGNGTPLANGSFTNLWDPECGQPDNSDPPQWNPTLQNFGIFQWYGTNHKFASAGIAKSQSDFLRPLIYLNDNDRVSVTGQSLAFKSSPMTENVSYYWNFGDGTNSTLANPSKTYNTPGIYNVTLTTTYTNGTFESEPLKVIVEPVSGTTSSVDSFESGIGSWQYVDTGLNGADFSQSEANYVNGKLENGTIQIEAFNYSPGWNQSGSNVMSDSIVKNAGGRWFKPLYVANDGSLTVGFDYKVLSVNINNNDRFKILVLDNDTVVKNIDFTGDQNTNFENADVQFNVSAGMHRIGLALWTEKLHTNGTVVDPDENSTIRRSNLLTHRFDHMDNNSKIQAWFDEVSINIDGVTTVLAQVGEVVTTYVIPSVFNSLNGLAWDGSQLWAVDYVESGSDGKAYRIDITAAQGGNAPAITRTHDLNILRIEGAAHDGANSLYIGPRVDGSRASAKIIEINDTTGLQGSSYTDFLWPDGQTHGDYFDPDGIAHDGTNIYWVVNGDHSGLSKAGVQMMDSNGTVLKRFWLPDKKPNDVTCAGGFLIYKPANNNVIKLIKIDSSPNGGDADVNQIIPIIGASITGHWGAAHDGTNYLYLSQDPPGGLIWKIYLPIVGSTDNTPPTTPLGLTGVSQSESEINLTWQAASDPESGVIYYSIYRNGTNIGKSTTSSFTDTGLSSGTTYSYKISAVNGAGLESDISLTVSETTFTGTTPPSTNQNLIGHWKLDDSNSTVAIDSSVNSNNATLVNGPIWTVGKIGGALDFDGTNDFLEVPHSINYLIENGTLSFWFNAKDVTNQGLCSKDSRDFDTGGHFTIMIDSNSTVVVRFQSKSATFTIKSALVVANNWYHVIFTFGNDGMKLYLDGQEEASNPYTGGLGITSGGSGNFEPIVLGAASWSSNDLVATPISIPFNGKIDDLRIYDRALTADEVQVLFNGSTIDTIPPSPPLRVRTTP